MANLFVQRDPVSAEEPPDRRNAKPLRTFLHQPLLHLDKCQVRRRLDQVKDNHPRGARSVPSGGRRPPSLVPANPSPGSVAPSVSPPQSQPRGVQPPDSATCRHQPPLRRVHKSSEITFTLCMPASFACKHRESPLTRYGNPHAIFRLRSCSKIDPGSLRRSRSAARIRTRKSIERGYPIHASLLHQHGF